MQKTQFYETSGKSESITHKRAQTPANGFKTFWANNELIVIQDESRLRNFDRPSSFAYSTNQNARKVVLDLKPNVRTPFDKMETSLVLMSSRHQASDKRLDTQGKSALAYDL